VVTKRSFNVDLGFPEGDLSMTAAERQADETWRRFMVYGSVRAVTQERARRDAGTCAP